MQQRRQLKQPSISFVVPAALAFLLLLLIQNPAAAKEKVSLKADGQVIFNIEDGSVYAEDNVVLLYKDIELRADKARYDGKEKRAYLLGHVLMTQQDQVVQAESLVYDFSTETSELNNVTMQISGEGMKGFAYVTGGKVTSTTEVMHIEDGTVTTCDLVSPHYHLRSKSIEIYLDERIVIRDVVYYEGRVPLFYWPYLVISIVKSRDGTANTFEFPRVGYSESEGWWVKTAYNYLRSPDFYGKLRLDWMQKKGWGKGVDHTYQDDENGYGVLSLYHLAKDDWGESISSDWKQRLELGDGWTFDSELEYIQRDLLVGSSSDLSAEVDLSRQTRFSGFGAQVDYQQNRYTSGLVESDLLGQVDYTHSWGQRWKVQLGSDIRWLEEEQDGHTEVRDYQSYVGKVVYTDPKYEIGVKVERELNPDLLKSTIDSTTDWVSASHKPQVYYKSRNWRWLGGRLPMLFSASYSRYEEEYPDGWSQQGTVYTVLGGIDNKVLRLDPKTQLSYTGIAQYDWYDDVESAAKQSNIFDPDGTSPYRRLVLSSKASLRYNPIDPVTLTLGYNDDVVMGETPFLLDEIEQKQEITGQVAYRTVPLTASLSTGYDFHTARFQDVVGQVGYHPNERLNISMRANYDVQEETVENVYALLKVKPLTGWDLSVGSSYNVAERHWERMDARTSAKLFWGLSLQHLISYDGATQSLLYNDVAITKDLHCREITLRYSAVNKEVWLEFSLKAFPRTKLLAGKSDDKMLFDAEGIEELIEVVTE